MARIRSVHPSLWTDENFVSMQTSARLFLIGLWNEADDFGVFAWKPLGLKMRLAPADSLDVNAVLSEIEEAGFIVRIDRGGKPYGVVKNFLDFQRPKNPSAPLIEVDSEIKAIVGPHSGSHKQDLPHSSSSPTPDLPENRGQMEDGIGKVGSEPKGSSPRVGAHPFSAFWDAWPSKAAKAKAEVAWKKLSDADRAAATANADAWFRRWRDGHAQASPILASSYLNQKRWQDEIDQTITLFPSRGQTRGERYRNLSEELDARIAQQPFD